MLKMITFIPKIRFKSFLNHWSYTRLKEVKDVRDGTHSSPKYIDNGYPLVTSKNLTDSGLNLNDVSLISESDYIEINKRSKVEVGDILLGLIGTIGKPVLVETDGFAIKNVGLIKNGGEIQNQFLLQYLKTNLFNKYIQIEMAGNTQKFLGLETLRNTKVPVPSQDEQSAIGSLFRTLDDLLTSYKDNLANYQSLKATMLSKMFPKAGQTVPEIRLDGFEGEWENSKISDYVYLLNGRAFKQDELLNEGKYRVVRVGNFNTNEKWYYSNLELEENKYADKEDLLYLWATNFGPEIWKEEKIIFHYHIWKLEFDRSIIDRNYLYYWLEKDKKRIQQNTNGSTMVHVTKSMMENREFLFPMFREQQAIGTYFSNLDNLIAAHQEKISQLETLKKKLLQDMFI